MGGKALKNVQTRRYMADEYHKLVPEVENKLKKIFENKRIVAIPAYSQKESYGDMDVLVEGPFPSDFVERVQAEFNPGELVSNGPVCSFEYKELQIDLIRAPSEEYDISLHYYSFNDLGNLLGKIAHKFGVKYGHDGLYYIHRNGDHVFAEIVLTRDVKKALSFLGLPVEPYLKGFDTLEEVFAFVATSPYFSPYYYLLTEEQKNATDRVRANKRQSYQKFMSWLEEHKESLTAYTPLKNKAEYLPMINEHFPHFEAELQASFARAALKNKEDELIATKLSSEKALEWVGGNKKTLGQKMQQFNVSFTHKDERRAWLLQATPEEVYARFMTELSTKENQ